MSYVTFGGENKIKKNSLPLGGLSVLLTPRDPLGRPLGLVALAGACPRPLPLAPRDPRGRPLALSPRLTVGRPLGSVKLDGPRH